MENNLMLLMQKKFNLKELNINLKKFIIYVLYIFILEISFF